MTRNRSNRIAALIAAAAAAGTLAGCGSTSHTTTAQSSGQTSSHIVTLKNIAFHPATITASVGDSVTWKWQDADIDTEHNVTSTGTVRFASSTTKMTGTYTVRFTHPGTYRFDCTIHPQSMHGQIVVDLAS